MAPRETKNNAYAKFWGDKQRTLWYVTVISGVVNFSQVFFFYKRKNFLFLLWVNLYMITDTYLHDPPPFNGPFFMNPPFSAVSKSCEPPSVSTPLPLLISDKSLTIIFVKSQSA